ncbi:hypothetical protein EGT07_10180 [Herbaspirillum sp. HC18]|nr:hypothetical protein EGT07_10180 [Herbaspirillum sp. HC18]
MACLPGRSAMKRRSVRIICSIAFLSIVTLSVFAGPVPLSGRVTDLTGKLSADALSFLSSSIEEGEANGGPRIKVVVVDTCEPETIDACAEKLLAAQPSGQRPDALLLLQPNVQTARIAVTDAARTRISPVAARVILRESVLGYLRDNNVFSAIEQGTRAIEKAWREPVKAVSAESAQKSSSPDANQPVEIPPYAPVIDLTNTLAPQDIEGLRSDITALRAKKGTQAAVLMLASTRSESVEEFAVRAFEQWRLGRKGVDDGVLIVIAKDDRRMRIEVGYGLEGVLTDAIASRIINEQMRPNFKRGDFGGGLTAALEQISRVVDGEALPPPVAEGDMMPTMAGLATAFAILVLAAMTRLRMPAFVPPLAAGGGTAIALWFTEAGSPVAFFLACFAALLAHMLADAIMWSRRPVSKGRKRDGDDWGIRSSERTSSGSSSGSDSGGGGRSGGGGASGSW